MFFTYNVNQYLFLFMKNQSKFYQNALQYGAILGLTLIFYFMVLNALGATQSKIAGLANYVFVVVALYMGNKVLRDQIQGGYLSYARALGSGTLISTVSGVLQSVFMLVFYKFISPESLVQIMNIVEEEMVLSGKTDQEIELAMKMSGYFMNPAVMSVMTLLGTVLMGFIFSLIVAAIVKKDEPMFSN